MTAKPSKLSIVIPAYNEAATIFACLQRVEQADSLGLTKEIIVINDGSRDDTADIVRRFMAGRTRDSIQLLELERNSGKTAALKKGLAATSGDIVIIQDADLEYDPHDYPRLLEPFLNFDAEVVYGSRFISHQPHRVLYFWHYLGNRSLTFLSNALTNLNLTDMETGYKAFLGSRIRPLADRLTSRRFGFEPEITALVAKRRLRVYEVGISYRGRTYEEGKKITWLDGLLAIGQILYFNLF